MSIDRKKAKDAYDNAEAKTDSILRRLADSPYTVVVLAVVAVALIALAILL